MPSRREIIRELRCAILGGMLALAVIFYKGYDVKEDENSCYFTSIIIHALIEGGYGYASVFHDLDYNTYILYVNDSTGDWRLVGTQNGILSCVVWGGKGWQWALP